MNPRLTSRCPLAFWQMNELTIATPVWLASFCSRLMISPFISSASSGWSQQKPVANISGSSAMSAFPVSAAMCFSACCRFCSLSAHAMGYCNSATFIVGRC